MSLEQALFFVERESRSPLIALEYSNAKIARSLNTSACVLLPSETLHRTQYVVEYGPGRPGSWAIEQALHVSLSIRDAASQPAQPRDPVDTQVRQRCVYL